MERGRGWWIRLRFFQMLLLLVSVGGFSQARKPDAETLFRQAQQAAKVQRDYTRAIRLCKESLKLAPDNTDPRELLGRLYMLTGQNALARAELKRVIARFPSNKDVLLNLINIESAEGNLNDAISYCDRYLKYDSGNKDVIFRKASFYARQKRYKEAIVLVNYLLRLEPASLKYQQVLVEYATAASAVELSSNNVSGAYAMAYRAMAVDSSNRDLMVMMMNIHYRAGKTDSSILMCNRLLGISPNDSGLLVKKASMLQEAGRLGESLEVLNTLLRQYPGSKPAELLFRDVLLSASNDVLKQGKSQEARYVLIGGLAVLPDEPVIHTRLSLMYNEARKYDSAVWHADKVLSAKPEDSLMLLNKTLALQSDRQYKEAARTAETLVKLYPEQAVFRELYQQLRLRKYRNQVSAGYLYSIFTEGIGEAQIATVQYFHYFRTSSVGVRVNYGTRPAGEGVQVEAESYISHGRKSYSYLIGGWSPDVIFPSIRAGYSYFQGFGKNWEAELGARYLLADSIYSVSGVASISKFIGSYWFNLRGFAINEDRKWYQSYILNNRIYFKNQLDYFSFFGSMGSMPDDRNRNFQFNSTLGFLTWSAGIGLQKRIHPAHAIVANVTWTRQKTSESTAYSQYDLTLMYQIYF